MDYGSAEFRKWCMDNGAAIQLGVSFSGDMASTPLAFLTPIPESMLPCSQWLHFLFTRAGVPEISRKCVEARHNFQWRCSFADVAKACTAWPDDIVPRVYASADKALTIEINKRKHAATPAALGDVASGAQAAQAGIELAGAGLDLALKKLRVAGALIEFLRSTYSSPPFTDAQIEEITLLLCEWDKLKGK